MLRRALLAVVVISYLTCVLYLSGLQKNDPSVNSLRKSKARSVNIPNANNEKLEEVLQNGSVAKKIKIDKFPLRAPPVELPSKDLGKIESKNHNSSNLRDRRTVEDEGNLEEESTSNEKVLNENINIVDADNNTKIIQYTEEKPNLRKVITFWQELASRNQETTTEKPFIYSSTTTSETTISETTTVRTTTTLNVPITTPKKKRQTDKVKTLRRLVVNDNVSEDKLSEKYLEDLLYYTSKETTLRQPSTTPAPQVRRILDDDTDIFNDLLGTGNKESVEMHKYNARMSNYAYEFKFAKIKCPLPDRQLQKKNQESIKRNKELQEMFIRDFNNLEHVVLNKQTTWQSSFLSEDYYTHRTSNNNKEGKKTSVKPIYSVLGINNYVTTTSTPLPDMIKELAENVKNLIINDLHKHDTTTMADVTTAPTTRYYTGNKNYIVIEKIMELLQKYKTESNIDEAPTTEITKVTTHITPRVVRRPRTRKKVLKKKNNIPNPIQSNRHGNNKKIPVRNKFKNLKYQPIIPIRHLPPQVSPVIGVSPNIVKDIKPITIQTNLLEIPPLGVPVYNPASIISHNIIITTIRSYVQNYPLRHDKFINHQTSNKIRMTEASNKVENTDLKDDECDECKKKIAAYRMRDHESIDSSIEEGLPMKMSKKNPTRYENVLGFHEKIENDQQSQADIDELLREYCSKEDIFPRDQPPIKYIKRDNDVAFKKLLRSQQRVTEMLEQMLASKGEPLVETT